MFSEWLLKEMNIRGWSQADLARKSGLTTAGVSRLITGNRRAGVKTVMAIAKGFKLPAEYVFIKAGILPEKSEATMLEMRSLRVLQSMTAEEQEEMLRIMKVKIELREEQGRNSSLA